MQQIKTIEEAFADHRARKLLEKAEKPQEKPDDKYKLYTFYSSEKPIIATTKTVSESRKTSFTVDDIEPYLNHIDNKTTEPTNENTEENVSESSSEIPETFKYVEEKKTKTLGKIIVNQFLICAFLIFSAFCLRVLAPDTFYEMYEFLMSFLIP